MLSERVHREQDIVACQVCCHGVRPVKECHLYKDQFLSISDIQRVPGFHNMKIPFTLTILSFQRLYRVGRAVDRSARDLFYQGRKTAGMIILAVINNDIINLFQVDL